ncbi:putative leucine-rich repeat receptor-like protein kinase [Glycine soja]
MLDLSNNKGLTGSLPHSIGNLTKLSNLFLVDCGFTGPIPDEIGSLKELVFLSLNSNSFSGGISASIGNLPKLNWLDIADNQLEGTIPISSGSKPGLDMLLSTKHFQAEIVRISSALSNLTMDAFYFYPDEYEHYEEPIESSKSSNAGFIIRAAIGDGSSLLVLLLLTGGCALWLKKKVEKAIQQNYLFVDEPLPTNKRYDAAKIFNHPDIVAEETWYGIEQEYTLLQKDVNWPLGWPLGGFPRPQRQTMLTLFNNGFSVEALMEVLKSGMYLEKIGLDNLEESLLLQADMMDLKARIHGPAQAYVMEARLDKGRGSLVLEVLVEVVQGDARNVLCDAVDRHRASVLNKAKDNDSDDNMDFVAGNVKLITTKEVWDQYLEEAGRDGKIDSKFNKV